ncbi:hypothetical protein [Rudanella lutea]|uniref:hypothetical protein n=1 Tax=Rudanella lutea TaxID=451374 RepID=UPI000375AD49|nr:hypothetical protein [Rudanella lutea]
MSVQEIETAISQLSDQEKWQLSDWFTEYMNQQWDKQLEEDAITGRLDDLIRGAKEDIRKGDFKPL